MNNLQKQFDDFFARGFSGIKDDANRAVSKESFMAGAGCAMRLLFKQMIPFEVLNKEMNAYIDAKIAEVRRQNHN